MSLKTLFHRPQPQTKVVEGVVDRFGMHMGNDAWQAYAFTLHGVVGVHRLLLSSNVRGTLPLGLVRQGDRIHVSGTLKDGDMRDCTVTLSLDGRDYVVEGCILQ